MNLYLEKGNISREFTIQTLPLYISVYDTTAEHTTQMHNSIILLSTYHCLATTTPHYRGLVGHLKKVG